MPRSTSLALDAALAATITAAGYLVAFNLSPVVRWSSVGDQHWPPGVGGFDWVAKDFTIDGLALALENPLSEARIRVQNLDLAMTTMVLGEDLTDVTAAIYAVQQDVLAADDVLLLGTWELGKADLDPTGATIALAPSASRKLYLPRKRVTPENGLARATPPGTGIHWGNELFILESP